MFLHTFHHIYYYTMQKENFNTVTFIRGVLPSESFLFVLAPLPMRYSTTGLCPFEQAKCKAVLNTNFK